MGEVLIAHADHVELAFDAHERAHDRSAGARDDDAAHDRPGAVRGALDVNVRVSGGKGTFFEHESGIGIDDLQAVRVRFEPAQVEAALGIRLRPEAQARRTSHETLEENGKAARFKDLAFM